MRQKVLLLAILGFAMQVAGQQGTLSLFVRDGYNYYGQEAIVEIKGKGVKERIRIDRGGHLVYKAQPGKYKLSFAAEGFEPLSTFFVLENGKEIKAEIILDRKDFKAPVYPPSQTAVVTGYVVDGATGLPLAGAKVLHDGAQQAETDAAGFFKYESPNVSAMKESTEKPVRVSLLFEKDGYGRYEEMNVPMLPGRMLMRVTLYPGEEKVSRHYEHGVLDADKKKEGESEKNDSGAPVPGTAPAEPSSPLGCLTIPGSIRVGTSCSCTSCTNVSVMTLENYAGSGLDDEWIASWHNNSLEAGSVAYRSYGAWYVNNPVNANYDIASTTCNQAWGSTVYTASQNAAANMAGVVIEYNSNIARSEYSAENNNKGCGDGWSGTSTSWPCISDGVCTGSAPNGHGRGMCQWGSQRWANTQGQTSGWILGHYYNPGNMYVNYPSNCSPSNLSIASGSCPVIGATLSWTNSGTGWYLDISDDPNFTYFWNKDVTGLTSVMCPGGFCDYPNCTSYLQFQPNTTYYWRIWDGANHTYGSSFTTPYCLTVDNNCSGTIYDSGGPTASHAGNEDWEYVIEPTGAVSVSLTFNSFDLEVASDFVDIYDGNSTAAPLIGSYSGSTSPGTITGNNGALTLRFTSDPFVNNSGFEASWNCTLGTTGVEQAHPDDQQLSVFPNPFSTDVTAVYFISEKSDVKLSIVDLLGREVYTVVLTVQTPGAHKVKLGVFDGFAPGAYFLKAEGGSVNSCVKIIKK